MEASERVVVFVIVRDEVCDSCPVESGCQQCVEEPLAAELVTSQPRKKIDDALAIGKNPDYLGRLPPVLGAGDRFCHREWLGHPPGVCDDVDKLRKGLRGNRQIMPLRQEALQQAVRALVKRVVANFRRH